MELKECLKACLINAVVGEYRNNPGWFIDMKRL